jgi:hypothetical protein
MIFTYSYARYLIALIYGLCLVPITNNSEGEENNYGGMN